MVAEHLIPKQRLSRQGMKTIMTENCRGSTMATLLPPFLRRSLVTSGASKPDALSSPPLYSPFGCYLVGARFNKHRQKMPHCRQRYRVLISSRPIGQSILGPIESL